MPRSTDKLTDAAIRQAKPKSKGYKLTDGGQMYLWVNSDGSKLWRMDYHYLGERNTASFGSYPTVGLKAARAARAEAKAMLAQGANPNRHKKKQKREKLLAKQNSFEAVAKEWHTKKLSKWNPHHAGVIWRRLEMHVLPHIGKEPVSELRTPDLITPLQILEMRGTLNLASQVSQYIGGIMRHAVQMGLIIQNPANDIRGAISTSQNTERPALPLERLPELKQKLENYPHSLTVRHALQFALLTAARSSEFRFARWSEFDLRKAQWIIPPKRKAIAGIKHSERGEKMQTARIIPLARQTLKILKKQQAISGDRELVFASEVKRKAALSENTPNKTLQKLGYDTKQDICLHGFRTMACSSLCESGLWQKDAVERHMGHEERNKVRAAYTHKAEYLAERKRMLQWWADFLDAQREDEYISPLEFAESSSNSLPEK